MTRPCRMPSTPSTGLLTSSSRPTQQYGPAPHDAPMTILHTQTRAWHSFVVVQENNTIYFSAVPKPSEVPKLMPIFFVKPDPFKPKPEWSEGFEVRCGVWHCVCTSYSPHLTSPHVCNQMPAPKAPAAAATPASASTGGAGGGAGAGSDSAAAAGVTVGSLVGAVTCVCVFVCMQQLIT